MVKSLTTTTLRKGVYAFAFGQKGLVAGLGRPWFARIEDNGDIHPD
jgi:hypothetical protein